MVILPSSASVRNQEKGSGDLHHPDTLSSRLNVPFRFRRNCGVAEKQPITRKVQPLAENRRIPKAIVNFCEANVLPSSAGRRARSKSYRDHDHFPRTVERYNSSCICRIDKHTNVRVRELRKVHITNRPPFEFFRSARSAT